MSAKLPVMLDKAEPWNNKESQQELRPSQPERPRFSASGNVRGHDDTKKTAVGGETTDDE